jgi:hypothetical protein
LQELSLTLQEHKLQQLELPPNIMTTTPSPIAMFLFTIFLAFSSANFLPSQVGAYFFFLRHKFFS